MWEGGFLSVVGWGNGKAMDLEPFLYVMVH